MNKILMVLVFGLVLAVTAQPTNNAAEEKGKNSADRQCCFQSDLYTKKKGKAILMSVRLWNFKDSGS